MKALEETDRIEKGLSFQASIQYFSVIFRNFNLKIDVCGTFKENFGTCVVLYMRCITFKEILFPIIKCLCNTSFSTNIASCPYNYKKEDTFSVEY